MQRGAVTLVTGGARGIGAAVVRRFVAGGARVVIADVLDEDGKRLAEALGAAAAFSHLDVTKPGQWHNAIAGAEAAFGPISVLVNNAGVVEYGGVGTVSEEAFRRVLEVNLTGAFHGIQAALPSLRRAGGGVIINISSTAGLTGYANVAAYVTSKWGLRGLTKAAALDLAADHIRVCSVHPGPIHTLMTAGIGKDVVTGQPIPRFGEPAEVAAMVWFIAAEASFSTGSEFIVDGGAVTGQVLPLPQ